MLYYTMTVLYSISIIHYNFTGTLNIGINIYFTLPYYAGIMLNAFNDPYAHNYAGIIGGSLCMTQPAASDCIPAAIDLSLN